MMPEGPEVRTLVDQLQSGVGQRLVNLQFVSGRYTTHGKPKGFEKFRQTMTSYKVDNTTNIDVVQEWNCKGKFIWLSLDGGKVRGGEMTGESGSDNDFYRSIWITLGMSGRFLRDPFEQDDRGTSHNQPRWYFEFLDEKEHNPDKITRKIYYYDTRNFGTLRFSTSKSELMEKLKSLGPDILYDCSEASFLELMRKQVQTMNICKLLMNQKKIAGIGNYILSEALYRSNVDPFASLSEISDDQAKLLYAEVVQTAKESYRAQGVTRRDRGSYRDIDGNEGNYSFSLQCYGREYCAKGKKVIRDTDGPHGRTIWYVKDQLFVPRLEQKHVVPRLLPSAQTDQSIVLDGNPTNEKMVNSSSTEQIVDEDLSLIEALQEDSWKKELDSFLNSETFTRLSDFVASERRHHDVYPPSQDVFSALNKCPFDDVKVVIIGQDPYHKEGQGNGLAFSVREGVQPPPSLRNIFKELEADVNIVKPRHGNLEYWATQGVLLLNTVLTVRQGKANSHSNIGWEAFTDEIVDLLNDKHDGLVFLLWGAPAAKKGKAIDESRHTVIITSHPSPLGATRTKHPFLVGP